MKTRNGGSAGQERLAFLRRSIARIEGRPAERLEPDGHACGIAPGQAPSPSAPGSITLVRAQGQVLGGQVLAGPANTRTGLISSGLISSGLAEFDRALGGGIGLAALTELRSSQTRHAASLSGFALALMSRAFTGASAAPLLWLSLYETVLEAGHPYLPGIAALAGLRPGLLFEATVPRLQDLLWLAEQAAASGAFLGLIVELRGNPKALGLDETRRLQRRAAMSETPVFLLRQAGHAEPTAAPCRLAVEPAPAGLRRTLAGPLEGSLGHPAFTVTIEKARAPSVPPFIMEWNRNDRIFRTPHPGDHAAASFDRPARPQALGPAMAQARAS